jgi:exodeoxyribonuclease V alpha subunit
LETINGKVEKVIFSNEDTGFKVVKIKLIKGPRLTITGEFGPDIVPGTVANFHGDYKTHPKYGNNFKTSGYQISHNQEEINSIQLFLDRVAQNIGPERAKAILKHFGSDLIKILDTEPHRLEEVEGIGKVSTESLTEAWKKNKEEWEKNRQEYSLRAFLNSLGIKERRVKKIISFFGGHFDAEEKIRTNPYLLTEIEGFGFSTADYIAKLLGVPSSDPLRLKAFLLYALNILCPANGHLYLSKSDMVNSVNLYCKEMSTTFLDKATIDANDLTEPIRALISEKFIEEDKDALYSKSCYKFEVRSAELLTKMLSRSSDLILDDRASVDRHIEEFERDSGIILSKEQRDALYFFVEKKVFIITGAPGTGKTTILKAIVSLIHKFHLNLTCMTPTGISAKKMSETINYDAYTIHRRLGFRGNEWMNNETNKFETDVVIIDEASMVDMEVLYRLLCALKERVHLIIVGDDNQLPSVGAGNVLRELINCGSIPIVRLEQIFRQNEASDIIRVAHKIKNGDIDLTLFKSDPEADVFFYREKDLRKIEEIIIKLATKFKNENKINNNRLFQIITPRNDGPLSVNALNTVLQNVLNPASEELKEVKCFNFILRRGDRIIVRKNDYENGIFNGDIGKVTSILGGYVTIQIDGRDIQLTVDEIQEKIKLAYSITVHRSQGQEYPYVILPFINQFGKMLLQRNLLYTAITRAKKKVIVIGHGSALERAISNASVYKRNTKLGEKINQCLLSRKDDSLQLLLEGQVISLPAQSSKEPFSYADTKFSAQGIIEG